MPHSRRFLARGIGCALLSALMLTACDESATTPSSTPPPGGSSGTMSISIVRGASTLTTTAFAPSPLTVSAGTRVTWTNNDGVAHDATSVDRTFATGVILPGDSASVTLQTPGHITYYCTIHPGMTGTIDVL